MEVRGTCLEGREVVVERYSTASEIADLFRAVITTHQPLSGRADLFSFCLRARIT